MWTKTGRTAQLTARCSPTNLKALYMLAHRQHKPLAALIDESIELLALKYGVSK
jgi:hypothetical protein